MSKIVSYKVTNLSARAARKVRNAIVRWIGCHTLDVGLAFHDHTDPKAKGATRPAKGKYVCEWVIDTTWNLDAVIDRKDFKATIPEGLAVQKREDGKSYRIIATN